MIERRSLLVHHPPPTRAEEKEEKNFYHLVCRGAKGREELREDGKVAEMMAAEMGTAMLFPPRPPTTPSLAWAKRFPIKLHHHNFPFRSRSPSSSSPTSDIKASCSGNGIRD
jgi:hypothetical protein